VRAACLRAEGNMTAAATTDSEARRRYTELSGGQLPVRGEYVF
jgi:hypothetical protein